jgi:hypothetical protein
MTMSSIGGAGVPLKEDEQVPELEISLAEAKFLYTLLAAPSCQSRDCALGLRKKIEDRLYSVLSIDEMDHLNSGCKDT